MLRTCRLKTQIQYKLGLKRFTAQLPTGSVMLKTQIQYKLGLKLANDITVEALIQLKTQIQYKLGLKPKEPGEIRSC
mgnify:CR=1 FL=1